MLCCIRIESYSCRTCVFSFGFVDSAQHLSVRFSQEFYIQMRSKKSTRCASAKIVKQCKQKRGRPRENDHLAILGLFYVVFVNPTAILQDVFIHVNGKMLMLKGWYEKRIPKGQPVPEVSFLHGKSSEASTLRKCVEVVMEGTAFKHFKAVKEGVRKNDLKLRQHVVDMVVEQGLHQPICLDKDQFFYIRDFESLVKDVHGELAEKGNCCIGITERTEAPSVVCPKEEEQEQNIKQEHIEEYNIRKKPEIPQESVKMEPN